MKIIPSGAALGARIESVDLAQPLSARDDAAIVAALGDSRDLAVKVGESTKDGTVRTSFASPVGSDTRLREFAARQ